MKTLIVRTSTVAGKGMYEVGDNCVVVMTREPKVKCVNCIYASAWEDKFCDKQLEATCLLIFPWDKVTNPRLPVVLDHGCDFGVVKQK